MGENRTNGEAKYIHGIKGKGFFTFYGGHDPEDYTHKVGDPKTELELHPTSPGYRLILNNVLFPAAKKKKQIMATKTIILNKIQILITNHFTSPEDAFSFFDKDSDGKLTKREIRSLLKQAEISGFLRGLVSTKLIEGYDKDGDGLIDWEEFKTAIDEIAED